MSDYFGRKPLECVEMCEFCGQSGVCGVCGWDQDYGGVPVVLHSLVGDGVGADKRSSPLGWECAETSAGAVVEPLSVLRSAGGEVLAVEYPGYSVSCDGLPFAAEVDVACEARRELAESIIVGLRYVGKQVKDGIDAESMRAKQDCMIRAWDRLAGVLEAVEQSLRETGSEWAS